MTQDELDRIRDVTDLRCAIFQREEDGTVMDANGDWWLIGILGFQRVKKRLGAGFAREREFIRDDGSAYRAQEVQITRAAVADDAALRNMLYALCVDYLRNGQSVIVRVVRGRVPDNETE